MNHGDAAECGVYASELFRYVGQALTTTVAEIMLPLPDLENELGTVTQSAREVGKVMLRRLAQNAGPEQRLSLSELKQAVNEHLRKVGKIPRDDESERRREYRARVVDSKQADEAVYKWATELPPDVSASLLADTLETFPPESRYLFQGKDLTTSKTLRMLAFEHHRVATAFD